VRIRTIKPEFWKDERISSIPFLTRLVYIALWNESDDQGRLRGNPVYLKSVLFPYDEIDMKAHLISLKGLGVITEYSVRAQAYLYLVNFHKHQRINRPSDSRLPAPEENDGTRRTAKPTITKTPEPIHEDTKQITEDSVKCMVGTGNREQGTRNMDIPAKEPESSSSYTTCVSKYYELYQDHSGGKKPRWNGRNGKALKDLLGSVGEQEVLERMEWMFDGKSWLKPPYTFGSMVTNWDTLVPTSPGNNKGAVSGDDLRDLAAQLRARGE